MTQTMPFEFFTMQVSATIIFTWNSRLQSTTFCKKQCIMHVKREHEGQSLKRRPISSKYMLNTTQV